MARKIKFPKRATAYAIGATFMVIMWVLTDDTDALIIAAWLSVMSKLEEMSEVRSAPLYGDVFVSANKADWDKIARKGPGYGPF